MHHCLRLFLLVIIFQTRLDVVSAAAQESQPLRIESLSWLAGTWGSTEDGRETEEHWMSPKAGLMLGVNRSISKQGRASFEFLRIAEVSNTDADPDVVYYASPGGKPAVPFRLISSGEESAVFQNLENDFPQRIIYKLENEKLTARIEGAVDGKDQFIESRWNRTSD